MSNMSGINSQAGFCFQKEVFLYNAAKLSPGAEATYEGLDDVSIDCSKDENAAIVGYPEKKLVQVKLGNVTTATMRRVVCNWMIAAKKNPSVRKLELVVRHDSNVATEILENTGKDFYSDIVKRAEKAKRESSLFKQVEKCLEKDEAITLFEKIKGCNITHLPCDVNDLLREAFAEMLFRGTAEFSGAYFDKRIEELKRRIFFCIDESMQKKKAFVLSKESLIDICEDVVACISANRYTPDYESFVAEVDTTSLLSSGGRHVHQLEKCELSNRAIQNALEEMAYYSSIRNYYLERANLLKPKSIERTAYSNFEHAVLELGASGIDKPALRFVNTRKASNSYCSTEQEKWGACVYLTRDGETDYQITWWDEEIHGASG